MSDLTAEDIDNFFSELGTSNAYFDWYAKATPPLYLKSIEFIKSFLDKKRILELGSHPFLFSLLLKQFFPDNVYFFTSFTPAQNLKTLFLKKLCEKSFLFKGLANRITTKKFMVKNLKTAKEYAITTRDFNIERDVFPYENESFDLVLAMNVLEHLKENPAFTIKEVNRVLKSNGAVFLLTPNAVSWANFHRMLNNLPPNEGIPFIPGGITREYSPEEIKHLLKIGGFVAERIETKDIGYTHLKCCLKNWLTYSASNNISDLISLLREEWISAVDASDIRENVFSRLKESDSEKDSRGLVVMVLAKKGMK